jgi:hypothetical protein
LATEFSAAVVSDLILNAVEAMSSVTEVRDLWIATGKPNW